MPNALATSQPLGSGYLIQTANAGYIQFIVDVSGSGGVASVFGRTGAVVAVNGDYSSSQITNLSSVPGATVTAALNALLPQAINENGNFGATPSVNFSTNRYQRGTLNVNAVFTFAGLPTTGYECYLELVQGAGGQLATFPANCDFSGGEKPELSTTAGAVDLLKFVSNGTRLRCYVVGLDLLP